MITFSGLDGAGKSTQIELLENYWLQKGNKVKIFWSRGGYTPGMEKFKSILRSSKSNIAPLERGHTEEREKSFSKPIIRKVWLSLAIVDLIFYYSIYIRVKELLGTKIICDRYIFDTLIDFKLNYPQENIENWLLWKFLISMATKPKKHFVLTIPVDESQSRSKLKNEPFPDTKETLEKRLKEYFNFVAKNKYAIHIDGTNDMEKIHRDILKEVVFN